MDATIKPGHHRLRRLPLSAETAGRVLQVACVALLAGGTIGIAVGNDAVIGLCFGLGFVALLLGALLPVVTRRQRQLLEEMVAGERFVHWTYDREDWRRHLAANVSRA